MGSYPAGIRRPLLESEILAAQSISKTEHEVARKLGVAYPTYKKYATLYGLYGRVMNKAGKGIKKPVRNEEGGKYPLSRILNNEFPDYSTPQLRIRLLRSGKFEHKCNKCGFNERRLADGKVPLILNYKDGNPKNKLEENIEFLCYNCYFLNVNNPSGRKKRFKIADINSDIKEIK